MNRLYHGELHDLNFRGEAFPSGQNYWPDSVSEMVQDQRTQSGKVWIAFEEIGAISIWMSWYPWRLRNVRIGPDRRRYLYWFLNARAMVPSIGMLMIVNISLPSVGDMSLNANIAAGLHLVGAVLLFFGESFFELFTLYYGKAVPMKRNGDYAGSSAFLVLRRLFVSFLLMCSSALETWLVFVASMSGASLQ